VAVIYEQGKPYWLIVRRFHQHRHTSTAIGPAAVRDMLRLQQESQSSSVLRRVNSFISSNHPQRPGPNGNGSGPTVA